MRPPPDYPTSAYPFLVGGGLAPAAQKSAVVSIALRYLGARYRWGGARPKTGFDCSGLVQYVFAQLGVSLPHYAAAQYYSPDAIWVPPNRLQPGDLVFFTGSDGTRRAPGHVGIYVGDGYLIDAPHTGAFVRIDRLNEPWFANNYVGAKRIVASLHARHLLRPITAAPTPPKLALLLRQPATSVAFAQPVQGIAALRTAAHTSAPHDLGPWIDAGLGGALLVLCAGGITSRRHERAPEASPNTDTSN